jgi:O-antigen ligase
MDKIILLPLFISAAMLISREPKDVFILVFLPSLTLLPTYFDVEVVNGTPELYFWSAALIPILIAWVMNNLEGYQLHWMDLVILGYLLSIFYGQWANSDYKQSQKLFFNNLMTILFPYLLVRAFCEDRETLIRMIRMMTFLAAFIAVIMAIEFRIFTNYFDEILRRMWPGYVMWDIGMVLHRWGFKRAFGPFSHPIAAGYFFSLITPLAIWCYFQEHYHKKNIGRLVVALNVLGLIVALSRAPMMGFFMGLVIIYYGWSQNKAAIMSIVLLVATVVLMMAVPKFIEYASVTRATAATEDQRNVAYRKEMWEAYTEVVLERPYLGWGRFSVPAVKGMKSIDSEYLGVALASGLPALGFYLVFLFGMLYRMVRFASRGEHDDPWARLAWCLIAGWVSAIFSLATVYSGAQTVQYLYMLGAVGQVLILTPQLQQSPVGAKTLSPELANQSFHFIRVI